jgi:acyl-CoA thioester hydrolase
VRNLRAAVAPSTDPAAYPFAHRLRARFAETDAMGVVHHAAYLPWLEEGRVEYLRSIGHPYAALRRDGIEFPVVEAALAYRRPVFFDDPVDVHLVVASAGAAVFTVAYLLAVGPELRATAVTVHGVVRVGGGPTRCPAWLRVLAAPAEPAPSSTDS